KEHLGDDSVSAADVAGELEVLADDGVDLLVARLAPPHLAQFLAKPLNFGYGALVVFRSPAPAAGTVCALAVSHCQSSNRSHAWPTRGGPRAFAPCPRGRLRPQSTAQSSSAGEPCPRPPGAGTPPAARTCAGPDPRCAQP